MEFFKDTRLLKGYAAVQIFFLLVNILTYVLRFSIPASVQELDAWLYPANVLCYVRVFCIALALLVTVQRGCYFNKWCLTEDDEEDLLPNDMHRTSFGCKMHGPLNGTMWLLCALSDILDGPIARDSKTTSQLGGWLDHNVADQLGWVLAWACARSALPELDIIWVVAFVRTVTPHLEALTFTYMPCLPCAAWLYVCAGFIPLIQFLYNRLLVLRSLRLRVIFHYTGMAFWYIMMIFMAATAISYPIEYSPDNAIRLDNAFQSLFGMSMNHRLLSMLGSLGL